ncbi:hypothetical protein C8R47DRAFT_603823 [Mycena vitilis]|nr:hypothetical protein C8R47DRAFT_603823 [Mycena vitilis]
MGTVSSTRLALFGAVDKSTSRCSCKILATALDLHGYRAFATFHLEKNLNRTGVRTHHNQVKRLLLFFPPMACCAAACIFRLDFSCSRLSKQLPGRSHTLWLAFGVLMAVYARLAKK